MGKLNTAFKLIISHPEKFFATLIKSYGKWMSDTLYIRLLYRCKIGHKLNLNNPKRFTEKIQWLKLNNRNPRYTTMVDKAAVKDYVKDIIGSHFIIPTLGVWDRFDDIDFDSLPNKFVLKTTHGGGGGGVVICKDVKFFDKQNAKEVLERSLAHDIYKSLREWPYKNVIRRIIAETYIEDGSGDLRDYKFFCFNGKVKFFKIDFGRFKEHHANYYDIYGNLLPFGEINCAPDFNIHLDIPHTLSQMIQLSEKIACGEPFLRVDFYTIGDFIYFGETTFYPASGLGRFTSDEWDYKIGDMLNLNTDEKHN